MTRAHHHDSGDPRDRTRLTGRPDCAQCRKDRGRVRRRVAALSACVTIWASAEILVQLVHP